MAAVMGYITAALAGAVWDGAAADWLRCGWGGSQRRWLSRSSASVSCVGDAF